MNNETKVVLTINGIEGRTRHFVGKKKVKTELSFLDKRTGNVIEKPFYYKIPDYEYETISQRINLSQAFYDYATSNECPQWFYVSNVRKDLLRKWDKMTDIERLESHLTRIMLDNRGTSFTYNILEE